MKYSLRRIKPKPEVGDSGSMSTFIYQDDEKQIQYEHNSKPRIGGVIRVGSLYARTFVAQDWWQTSLITKILEETENYVKFKTLNSIYEWRVE